MRDKTTHISESDLHLISRNEGNGGAIISELKGLVDNHIPPDQYVLAVSRTSILPVLTRLKEPKKAQ